MKAIYLILFAIIIILILTLMFAKREQLSPARKRILYLTLFLGLAVLFIFVILAL